MWKGVSKFFISFCKEIRKLWITDGISIWPFLLCFTEDIKIEGKLDDKWKGDPNYLSLPEREDNFTKTHFHRWWKEQILTTDISQYSKPCFSAHSCACFCSTTRRPTRSVLFPTKTPTEKNNTKEKQPPRNADLLAITAGTFLEVAEKVRGTENSLEVPRKSSTKKTY